LSVYKIFSFQFQFSVFRSFLLPFELRAMAILLKVDNIIKLLEPILRGGVLTATSSMTYDGLLRESYDIFSWYQSAYGSKI